MTRGAIALLMAGALGCSRGGESRCAEARAEVAAGLELEAREAIEAAIAEVRRVNSTSPRGR